ncbi:MAG: DUF4442 domain-containing protein [Pseudobacteriovorax sp.]|nr:DUF4442 domain-containing protein [Pseudobacteriovorax sp.]
MNVNNIKELALNRLRVVLADDKFNTLFLRSFGWFKIPLLSYVRPTVEYLDHEKIDIRIPLRRRSKNHLGSMYFGAIMVGVDCAAGFYAAKLIYLKGYSIDFVFKGTKAEFLRRPTGDVVFSCDQGIAINELLETAYETFERQELEMVVTCRCPDISDEVVAKASLILSVKRRK